MKLTDIKHIFFDLDHTLWDFDKNSGLAFTSIFLKNRIGVEMESFLQAYTPINANYWKLYRENKVSQEELRYGRLRETFDKLKVEVNDAQIELLSSDYIDYLPRHNHLLEGTLEILEYLKPNYRLHIITNGFKAVQHLKMKNSGILDFFETVTTSEDAGVKKPDRLIFEKALEDAGARVTESVMIGDNVEADILGAKEIGMQAILYNYYGEPCLVDCPQVLKMKEIEVYL